MTVIKNLFFGAECDSGGMPSGFDEFSVLGDRDYKDTDTYPIEEQFIPEEPAE